MKRKIMSWVGLAVALIALTGCYSGLGPFPVVQPVPRTPAAVINGAPTPVPTTTAAP
jgi:hypothetical protein